MYFAQTTLAISVEYCILLILDQFFFTVRELLYTLFHFFPPVCNEYIEQLSQSSLTFFSLKARKREKVKKEGKVADPQIHIQTVVYTCVHTLYTITRYFCLVSPLFSSCCCYLGNSMMMQFGKGLFLACNVSVLCVNLINLLHKYTHTRVEPFPRRIWHARLWKWEFSPFLSAFLLVAAANN